jgi:hypothetical protein
VRWRTLAGLAALLAVGLVAAGQCRPVVVLHYSAQAASAVGYFYNDNDIVVKDRLQPGQSVGFRSSCFVCDRDWIEVSLPFASRDGVQITPPFSRADVYIDAATKIARVEKHQGFFARFGV